MAGLVDGRSRGWPASLMAGLVDGRTGCGLSVGAFPGSVWPWRGRLSTFPGALDAFLGAPSAFRCETGSVIADSAPRYNSDTRKNVSKPDE